MNTDKYDRTISLNCPTCGNTKFSSSDGDSSELVTCTSCGRTLTRDELQHENSENIAEHVEEVKAQAVKDVTKQLQDTLRNAFKGSNNIRIK